MHFLYISMKSLKSISNEWFQAICWSSLLLGIFTLTKCVEFSLTSFDTLKYDWAIKTIEILSFLPLINNSVTKGLSLLWLIISAIKFNNAFVFPDPEPAIISILYGWSGI